MNAPDHTAKHRNTKPYTPQRITNHHTTYTAPRFCTIHHTTHQTTPLSTLPYHITPPCSLLSSPPPPPLPLPPPVRLKTLPRSEHYEVYRAVEDLVESVERRADVEDLLDELLAATEECILADAAASASAAAAAEDLAEKSRRPVSELRMLFAKPGGEVFLRAPRPSWSFQRLLLPRRVLGGEARPWRRGRNDRGRRAGRYRRQMPLLPLVVQPGRA